MIYDVDYFIKKFEAIPENRWIVNSQSDGNGNHCAIGHCKNISGEYGRCSPTLVDSQLFSKEANALYMLFIGAGIRSVSKSYDSGWAIADVNNGDNPKYQQPTPKQRILAALYDIKKMQEPKPQVKEVIKYVSVPVTITEQSKELILS